MSLFKKISPMLLKVILIMLICMAYASLLEAASVFYYFPKSTNSTLYKNFTPNLLNSYDQDETNLRAQCQVYKANATFYCKEGFSSDYDERVDCALVNKQRWCLCMGLRHDCFRERDFYW